MRRGFGRIERRESGRYRAAYAGPDGRLYRAPTTFDAKEDAVAWLANRRAEIQMEVWAPDVAARGASHKAVRAYGAPGKEAIRAQAYSLLRTVLGSAASARPKPLIPCNPAHIRGAGNVK